MDRQITLEKQVYKISGNDGLYIKVAIINNRVILLNERNQNKFVFENYAKAETIKRWEEIMILMAVAMEFVKKRIDKENTDDISYIKRHGPVKAGTHASRRRKAKDK